MSGFDPAARRTARDPRRAARTLAVLFPLLGCGPAAPPNLLIIVSDALRADALRCYGGAADTPNVCGLSDRGTLFENAFSNAPWTLPSAVSMFAGMHAGVYERMLPGGSQRTFYHVPDGEWLFAEALRERGYTVLGFVDNAVARQSNALQGFEERESDAVDEHEIGPIERQTGLDTRDVRYRKLLPLLSELLAPAADPFAILLWIYDPHANYAPPAWRRDGLEAAAGGLPQPLAFYMGLGHQDRPEQGLRKLKHHVRGMTDAERELLRALYRAEVESMDERVGSVLRALELGGRADRTLVVFTSDHGEAFGEHRRFLHGNSYFGELLRVPLIVAGPGVARGRRVARRVSHLGLMPTLSEQMGVPWRDDVQGRSFAALLSQAGPGRDGDADSPLYAGGVQGRVFEDALLEGRFKLVRRRDGRRLLYDLEADRAERDDLADRHPEQVARMESRLRAIRAENERLREAQRAAFRDEAALRQIDEQTADLLHQLGYAE